MHISVDLDRIQQHQDYLRREQDAAAALLEVLEIQYQLARDLPGDSTAFWMRHIQFVQDVQTRVHQREKLLSDAHDTLLKANYILSQNISEGEYLAKKQG